LDKLVFYYRPDFQSPEKLLFLRQGNYPSCETTYPRYRNPFFQTQNLKRMKTVLRSGLFAASLLFLLSNASAQCEASNILIQNIQQVGTQTPGSCSVKFDLSFQLANNNGNKFIFLHGWREDLYPDYFDCVNGYPGSNGTIRPPMASDLAASFINIGIDNTGGTPSLMSSYTPDAGLTLNSADSVSRIVLPNGDAFFVVHGAVATFPEDCAEPFLIAFDFWSSQAAHAQSAQCVNCYVLYPINYFSIGGLANCANLTFAGLITNHTSTVLNGYTLVYADVNGDGHLAPSADVLIQDTTWFSIAAGPGTTAPLAGTIPAMHINQDLLVITNMSIPGNGAAAQLDLIISTQCAPLPVTFKSFTATRSSRTNVTLKWETANEINNRGFALLRNLGHENWEQIAFVNSQAADGNSDASLAYMYQDYNMNNGITQYRIKQVDYDGRSKFSEIRAVWGNGQKAETVVYPVPSVDGRVNVVFSDVNATRDVTLLDASGRLLRQWKAVTNNTIQIDNLRAGIYSLRIQERETGLVEVEKIIVTRN